MTKEDDALARLIKGHDAQLATLKLYDSYYEGTQPLSYMHPELLDRLDGQVRQLVINWPQLVVDSLDERLDIDGFRLRSAVSADEKIWEIWQENEMDEGSQRAHVDTISLGRAYVTVGAGKSKDDAPIMCDESALDVFHQSDPATREVTEGIRRWSSEGEDVDTSKADRATLYLPDDNVYFKKTADGWQEYDRKSHGLGMVQVIPIFNRMRRKHAFGVSELTAVIPVSDAACTIATHMMVTANFHAIPRYTATGVKESDFQDPEGRPVSPWETVTGLIWATENQEAKIGSIPAADLANFHNTMKMLASLVAGLSGLPLNYLGYPTENPASADGLRAAESRLIKRAERKQRPLGGSWERANRLAMRILTGKWDPALKQLETMWRNPATPTIAQVHDAATKSYQAGLVPKRQAREDMGYSQVTIARMEELDAKEAQEAADREQMMLGIKPTDPTGQVDPTGQPEA